MHNAWLDTLRRSRTRGDEVEIDDAPDLAAPDLAAPGHGPEATVAALTLAEVRRAMDALPADQRAVLMLVCVEEMSYREAPEVLPIPIGTVMSGLSRARIALSAATGINRAE
ncbi:MAG: sigma factor-like helix-turn-helix DNA-binding protein [Gemmobacter sp.]